MKLLAFSAEEPEKGGALAPVHPDLQDISLYAPFSLEMVEQAEERGVGAVEPARDAIEGAKVRLGTMRARQGDQSLIREQRDFNFTSGPLPGCRGLSRRVVGSGTRSSASSATTPSDG